MPSEGESTSEESTQAAPSSLVKNLRIVSFSTLLSRFLGLGRDIAMATLFGAGTTLDVFIVAFRLPNLSRQLFGEGALTTAFLPVFLREQTLRGDQAARGTLTAVAVVLTTFLSMIVLILEACVAWGLSSLTLSDSTTLLLQLLAILLPYMVLICTAALLSAALHALKIFLWPALVPVILNVVWLSGVGIAVLTTTDDDTRVSIVSYSITIAGMLQLLLPMFVLQRLGMGLTRQWRSEWKRVHEVITTMLPVVTGITVMQCNVVLDSLMAWGLAAPDDGGLAPFTGWGIPALLPAGTATTLYIGQRMYQFPLGVFGIALGTVLFPLLTQHAQAGNMAALKNDLTKGLRLTIAIALPASAGIYVLAEPLTNLLFRHGEFSPEDSNLTAQMIAAYGAGVWAYIGLTVLNRAFYATGDRITPMRFGIVALCVNVLLNVVLVVTLQGVGLALGSVLSACLQLLLTTRKMNRQMGPLDWLTLRRTLLRSMIATAVMVLFCYGVLAAIPFHSGSVARLFRLLLPFTAGILSYLISARILRMDELDEFLGREQSS